MSLGFLGNSFQRIAKQFPGLKLKLKQAGMDEKPENFIKKTFLSAFYMTTGIVIFFLFILAKFNVLKGFLVLFVPLIFVIMFFYMIKLPDLRISRKGKEISREIVFA